MMYTRCMLVLSCCLGIGVLSPLFAADEKENSPKAALQALNDFIGDWKGHGAPEKQRPDSKELWDESVLWSWKFKGDDVALVMRVQNGKYFQSGELRYLPDKKVYQLTL